MTDAGLRLKLIDLRERLREEGLEAEIDSVRVPESRRYYLGRLDALALAVAWLDDVLDTE